MYLQNLNYKILTPNGFQNFDGIKKQNKKTIKFVFSDNTHIRVTKNHLFGNLRADSLVIGNKINSKTNFKTIINIIKDNKIIDVYDPINVYDHLYYGNDIINHNCQFLGSNKTLIETVTLENLLNVEVDPILLDLNDALRVYEKPKENIQYIIGCDTAKGTGEHYSTIQVVRVDNLNPVSIEQVAVFESNTVDTYTFSAIINKVAIYYNNAYIMVENNAEGNAVITELHWNYENGGLVNEGSKTTTLGIRATKKTKPKAVLLMKRFIENNYIKIYDKKTIIQLTDFVEQKNNVYKCLNMDDDLVSALYWTIYFFSMDIMNETIDFTKQKDPDDECWGILKGIGDYQEDWSWVTS